ncbi:MAG: hypothetical protein OXG96_01010 [Acidobacteria bacterium]|nr:hypothetical protein [Acidobacteriota bacterium]
MARAPARILGIAAILLALGAAGDPGPAAAQTPLIRGYYHNLPLWSRATPSRGGFFGDFSRLRLMSEPRWGPLSLEIAYEHTIGLNRQPTSRALAIAGVPETTPWLDLQWNLWEKDQVSWEHRFDRLNLSWAPTGSLDLTLGRQTVSWATTLFLTPADPFSPFNPADPFRAFRGGVDAARLQFHPGPLSQVEVVVRPTRSADGREITALGRGLTTWKNWEISGWGGALFDEPAAAGAVSGSLGPVALRGEASLRRTRGETVLRGTLGIDRRLTVSNRDLTLVAEYQHDGLGAADAGETTSVLESEPFSRGELQVLGRDQAAAQVQYQLHPLWSLSLLWLRNLNDHSSLLAPSLSYSASNEVTLTGGVFKGFGEVSPDSEGTLASEYGALGTTAYLSLSIYF